MNKKPDNLWDTVLEASIDDNNNLVALVKEKGSMTINIKLSHEASQDFKNIISVYISAYYLSFSVGGHFTKVFNSE